MKFLALILLGVVFIAPFVEFWQPKFRRVRKRAYYNFLDGLYALSMGAGLVVLVVLALVFALTFGNAGLPSKWDSFAWETFRIAGTLIAFILVLQYLRPSKYQRHYLT